jgi:hypothetical protein
VPRLIWLPTRGAWADRSLIAFADPDAASRCHLWNQTDGDIRIS